MQIDRRPATKISFDSNELPSTYKFNDIIKNIGKELMDPNVSYVKLKRLYKNEYKFKLKDAFDLLIHNPLSPKMMQNIYLLENQLIEYIKDENVNVIAKNIYKEMEEKVNLMMNYCMYYVSKVYKI